ncbi:UDP-N-acetylglucosamine 2-epimerase (hydrolyzing) [Candidatus Uhrbacteria bacterium]|nr:UDP-N-acetylglucosamine 2-epimerase (hydrolyzing) [Candidatus Uhrbacteria bacterium]
MTSAPRTIAVVTGSRADYGLLRGTIRGISKHPDLRLALLVTGSHLAPQFGMTVRDIEADGFPITARIPLPIEEDTERACAAAMGAACAGFADVYEDIRPDILLVLGDRSEIFAAAVAAVPFRIPIAHIHGGECTEGAIDEQFRHALTKLSHLHFATIDEHAARILQMGEDSNGIVIVGAPGLDAIREAPRLDRAALATTLALPVDVPWGVVTYHPATTGERCHGDPVAELLAALAAHADVHWVCTASNADMGGRAITERIAGAINGGAMRGTLVTSLGTSRYASLLAACEVMVGNSSSGIIEAPSIGIPVVNVGIRQDGRIRAANVLDVPTVERTAIAAAIRRARSAAFHATLSGLVNPYDHGGASAVMVHTLATHQFGTGVRKSFRSLDRTPS